MGEEGEGNGTGIQIYGDGNRFSYQTDTLNFQFMDLQACNNSRLKNVSPSLYSAFKTPYD